VLKTVVFQELWGTHSIKFTYLSLGKTYPLQQHEQSLAATCGTNLSLGSVQSAGICAIDVCYAVAPHLIIGARDAKAGTRKVARYRLQELTSWWMDDAKNAVPNDGSETMWAGDLALHWTNNPLILAIMQNRLAIDVNPV
jgi:hypothetical protein